MNQLIQNFVITLSVLLIFMFGYFHLKPQVPQDKYVSLAGLYRSDLVEWRWFIDCNTKQELLLGHGTEPLDELYKQHVQEFNKPVYFEIAGHFKYGAINGKDLRKEFFVDKVIKVYPERNCESS